MEPVVRRVIVSAGFGGLAALITMTILAASQYVASHVNLAIPIAVGIAAAIVAYVFDYATEGRS